MAAPHSFKLLFFLFLLYSLRVITITSTMLCHDHERSALLHFKQSLFASSNSFAYLKTASWKASGNRSSDCCSWDGVECDDATGYVISLDLSSSLIHATFHSNSTLFSLGHLQNLNLADNNFMNSSIPPEISHLSSLSSINLSYSSFSGQIPLELSGMSKLTSIDLSFNYFSGSIPASIGNLMSKLTSIDLSFNYFSGSIPASIGNLTQLTVLSLSSNKFNNTGDLSWLQKPTKLTVLDLHDTNLHGDIPPSLANLTQLFYLSLSQNPFNKSRNLSWLEKLTKLIVLGLQGSNLYGDIPPSLAFLTQLTALDLQNNYFVGEIPPSLANLTQLTVLSLRNNFVVGEIPLWLMNMTQLIKLDLSFNQLTGQIPRSFSKFKNLEVLSLVNNNFAGTVEADIFLSSRNLAFLSLSGCKITFNYPHHTNFSLPKLEILQLNLCNLTEFPYFLQFQSNLRVLNLNGNNIHGNIPHWIWNASNNLEMIVLSANFLTAFEWNPIAIQSKSLRYIDISNNMLQGNLPIPPPNTYSYLVNNNKVTGEISPMICGVMSLKVLDLSSNSISGPIPQCLADSLEALFLQDNNFSGTIPQTYPKECDLKVMKLNQNQLTGEVPKSLSNCKMLQIFDLSNNQMKQTFPTWLGTLPQLQVLLLRSNMFHGEIGSPRNPSEFSKLCIIDLSHNALTGALPVNYIQIWNAMKVFSTGMGPYIGANVNTTFVGYKGGEDVYDAAYIIPYYGSMNFTNKGVKTEYEKISNLFSAIDLSSNKFTGQIPESFGILVALKSLNLSNNHLTGPIPRSLGDLTQLESLDLSQNKLSGVIPEQLAARLNFLQFFNVSHNLLSGHIPQSPHFTTFDNNSYIENSGLCGFPLSKNCGTVQSPPDEDEDDSDENKFPSGFDWFFILAGLGSGLVVGFVMGNILTDRHPWLIRGIVQKFGKSQKKSRTRKRQIIRA